VFVFPSSAEGGAVAFPSGRHGYSRFANALKVRFETIGRAARVCYASYLERDSDCEMALSTSFGSCRSVDSSCS
jgi:hypothetical protein